mmetsp:Transcript_47806/g.86010  ORF Transcript_47806/g.86010 Transcript_47806/m.86010 type:complete len:110 (-) Transcript_47806:443-772(-)
MVPIAIADMIPVTITVAFTVTVTFTFMAAIATSLVIPDLPPILIPINILPLISVSSLVAIPLPILGFVIVQLSLSLTAILLLTKNRLLLLIAYFSTLLSAVPRIAGRLS